MDLSTEWEIAYKCDPVPAAAWPIGPRHARTRRPAMNRQFAARLPFSILLVALLITAGCVTPWNTKLPGWMPGSLDYERREAEVQDPFPDTDLGPGTSMRPRGYDLQRSEATRAKERSEAAALRRQFGVPGAPPAPDLGLVYPEAVRP